MSSHVIITGAGLCGTLLAIRLANRGHQVTLLEKRGDLRTEEVAAGRRAHAGADESHIVALQIHDVHLIAPKAYLCGSQRGCIRVLHPIIGRLKDQLIPVE